MMISTHSLSFTTCYCKHIHSTTLLIMSNCKPNSELLSAIQGADTKGLKDVTPVENPAAKHDMAMFGVEKFDKNKLKTVETAEKNVLPTAEDIKQAKKAEETP
eukprot:GFUD01094351.1.p1 GENE.GFUD01094351.1~~GFUD01094351.1.p1  ORF type:complete len:103 (-),score=41.11 GFUD01094351.1:142-450(-)